MLADEGIVTTGQLVKRNFPGCGLPTLETRASQARPFRENIACQM
jgi:hypothetical protein